MRKRFFNGKRILTLLLALSLVVGEAGVVVAAPTVAEEQAETSVSANDVVEVTTEETEGGEVEADSVIDQDTDDATEVDSEEVEVEADSAKEPDADDVTSETAYNGTASKVIGVEGSWDYYSSISLDSGQKLYYTYVQPTMQSVKAIGTAATYKVENTGLYLYNGQYYDSASTSSSYGTVTFSSPIQLLPTEPVRDPATGLYLTAEGYYAYYSSATIGGVRYYYFSSYDLVDVVGVYATSDEVSAAITSFAVKDTDGDTLYYMTPAGKCYRYNYFDWETAGNGYTLFAYKEEEISFSAQTVYLDWNSISSEEVFLSPDGKVFYVGYQVEEDGVLVINDEYTNYLSADGQYRFMTSSYYYGSKVVNPGQSVKYRVRGLYYTRDELKDAEGKTKYTFNVFSVGEWSDTYVYTAPTLTKIATPTGFAVKAEYDEDDDPYLSFTWNAVPNASTYYIDMIRSDVALNGITAANWNAVYNKYGTGYSEFKALNPDAYWSSTYYSTSKNKYEYYPSYKYVYARIEAYSNENGYMGSDASEIIVAVVPEEVEATTANVPALQNFHVEQVADSNAINLAWTPVDANVAIYAVETAKGFPQYYTFASQGPAYAYANVTDANGEVERVNMYSELDEASRTKLSKLVQVKTTSGSNGTYSTSYFTMKPGVSYSFVAYTYDNEFIDTEKAPIATIDGVNYTFYTDMSAPTATVTAKKNLAKPSVNIASAVSSLKITMSGTSATGFEIYKKSGKKYKKLTTTTDSVYVDNDVKKNSKYNYKVRSYYYNKDSKVKCYSDYVFVTGETSDVVNMDLSITKKSKTSVTLKWAKVKGAVRYEIYRTNVASFDPYTESKKNDPSGQYLSTAYADKYELVKTIKKANTTKYVDKKLTAGEDYYYIVKAYYKNGKSTMMVQASGNVSLRVQTPALRGTLKGSTAKYTWDKDKFASKYEIRYRVYDSEGELVSAKTGDNWTVVSTKKTSYNISNVPLGGYAYMQIRAYGDKKYSGWSDNVYVYRGLGVVKNIKATNVTVKNAAGETKDSVKISWSKVSGALYYRVYRSTKQSYYNADTKKYYVPGDAEEIAKESNDDEGYDNEVYYDEYAGKSGTIVGTSAYDNAQLDTGVTYYYYVVAYADADGSIRSIYEDNYSYTASGKPASVTYKAAVAPTLKSKKGKATVTWTKIPGATKYYVYRSTKKNSGYKLVGTTKKPTFTDKKVSKGKTYYYKIEARGINGLKANFSTMSAAKKIKVKK